MLPEWLTVVVSGVVAASGVAWLVVRAVRWARRFDVTPDCVEWEK